MTDLSLVAERDIFVKRTGKVDVQEEVLFEFMPKPSSDELESILKSDDPAKEYIDMLFKDAEGKEYEEPVYQNPFDGFHESKIIGTRLVNPHKDYAEIVKSKVDSYIKDGWDVHLVYW
jgi:hypothetical protein